jgi:hypothetical protein
LEPPSPARWRTRLAWGVSRTSHSTVAPPGAPCRQGWHGTELRALGVDRRPGWWRGEPPEGPARVQGAWGKRGGHRVSWYGVGRNGVRLRVSMDGSCVNGCSASSRHRRLRAPRAGWQHPSVRPEARARSSGTSWHSSRMPSGGCSRTPRTRRGGVSPTSRDSDRRRASPPAPTADRLISSSRAS